MIDKEEIAGNITVEKVGKTVEEALNQALLDLGVQLNQVAYEILEQPSKGLFGFIGSKSARVKVTLLKVEVDPLEEAKNFLQNIFDVLKMEVSLNVIKRAEEAKTQANDAADSNFNKEKTKEYILINLDSSEINVLIGKHGQTLDALQYLTNIVANKNTKERVKIVLDVKDYRKRREETLTRLALRLADKVKRYREKIVLESMNPQERKVIHMALQNDEKILTYSEGEEPFRRVVIAFKH